ncbi:MAG TPA: hypothetical protein VH643_40020 [Gemmataceae bacterium]|jgi:exo-beta-1,3-glucanase (GH17 family)
MAHIKIEDLPVGANLTPEEEELIFGAGWRSFRPMLESLESREMMDAGLGYGLQLPLAQPTGGAPQLALVRQLASENMQQVNQFVSSTLETAQTAHAALRQTANNVLGMASHLAQALPASLSALGNAAVGLRQQLAQGQVADLSGLSVTDALKKGSNWIIYEPKTAAGGQYVGEAQIRQELQMLYNKGFRGIVTYSFDNGREEIPRIAKEVGFQQVIAGVWAVGNYEGEKANLTADRLKYIDGICVGNETQLRGDYSIDVLKSRVDDIRRDSGGKPTTTADAWHLYQQNNKPTELMKVGDWVFPNLHPWYEGGWKEAHQKPAFGVQFVQAVLRDHFNAGKTEGRVVALHESWWPSDSHGAKEDYAGSATPQHQREYFEALAKTNINFIYGEAFDQAWKSNEGDNPNMGRFGGHWGLWQDVNTAKEVVNTIYTGERPGYRGALANQARPDTAAVDGLFSYLAQLERKEIPMAGRPG